MSLCRSLFCFVIFVTFVVFVIGCSIRGRADQFLSAVRPLPTAERAIVAMGVAALATHAISRRGRLIRTTPE